MALDRLRRLLPDLGDEPATERSVDSVRHGADRVDADPDLDRVREDPPSSAGGDRRTGGSDAGRRP